MTCKECKYSKVNHSVVCGQHYEVVSCKGYVKHNTKSAERCKRYTTKSNIEDKVNSFEKVITSDLFDEIIDNT